MNPQVRSGLPVTVSDWLHAYRQGASPRPLLEACLRRVRQSSPAGIWIHTVSDSEFEQQLAALEAWARDLPDRAMLLERYPLFGLPYALKDNIDVQGAPTTAACPAFEYVAPASAAVVRKLQAAGAVWLGKTNLDQFATGLSGTRSPYGKPACVFNADYVSGGSSSGSAVAVAAGLVAFALGTDTAGSGRIPAAFNQVVGLKPTPGRVGTSGVVPACRTLDCVSIFALTVEDASHVLSIIEGPDPEDCYSRFDPGPASFPPRPLRIGVPRDVELAAENGYRAAHAAALAHARSLGHVIVPLDFALLQETAAMLYGGPWVAERHSVVEDLMRSRPDALDPAVYSVVAEASRYSATDAFRAQYTLESNRRKAAAIWNEADLLMVPTAPMHPRIADLAADPVGANAALGTYTNFVNLLGWCALALPAGQAADGLPFGVTFIAPANHDAALNRFGAGWQRSLDLKLGATQARCGDGTAVHLRSPAVRETLPLAVVGAHLSGMPLNGQLVERGARLARKTTTAPRYRLFELPDGNPPKPGLVRIADSSAAGHAIELEVWDFPAREVGAFLAQIAAPLGLGSVELADGRWVHGFLCEARAVEDARDVSHYGGWRHFIQSRSSSQPTHRNLP